MSLDSHLMSVLWRICIGRPRAGDANAGAYLDANVLVGRAGAGGTFTY